MAYTYPAMPAEEEAAALLRDRGWSVSAPSCPECRGMGFVYEGMTWTEGMLSGGTVGTKPCPNECPYPVLIL